MVTQFPASWYTLVFLVANVHLMVHSKQLRRKLPQNWRQVTNNLASPERHGRIDQASMMSLLGMVKRQITEGLQEEYHEAKQVSSFDERIDKEKIKRKEALADEMGYEPEDEFDIVDRELVVNSEAQQCLHAHNVIRQLYGLNELKWSFSLAYSATEWALILAERNKGTKHDTRKVQKFAGENIHFASRNRIENCKVAVNSWFRYDL